MNRLPGSLLLICFQQGPFNQKDLVRACLALPNLTRAWLASENKTWGLHIKYLSLTKLRSVPFYTGQGTFGCDAHGDPENHGISWSATYSKKHQSISLGIELFDHFARVLYFIVVCPRLPQNIYFEDLELAIQWILNNAPQSSLYFHICDHMMTTTLSRFLSKPSLPGTLTSTSTLLNFLRVYKQTALFPCSLFDALAKACSESQHPPINKS